VSKFRNIGIPTCGCAWDGGGVDDASYQACVIVIYVRLLLNVGVSESFTGNCTSKRNTKRSEASIFDSSIYDDVSADVDSRNFLYSNFSSYTAIGEGKGLTEWMTSM